MSWWTCLQRNHRHLPCIHLHPFEFTWISLCVWKFLHFHLRTLSPYMHRQALWNWGKVEPTEKNDWWMGVMFKVQPVSNSSISIRCHACIDLKQMNVKWVWSMKNCKMVKCYYIYIFCFFEYGWIWIRKQTPFLMWRSVGVYGFQVEDWEPTSPKAKDVLGTDGYIAPEAYLGACFFCTTSFFIYYCISFFSFFIVLPSVSKALPHKGLPRKRQESGVETMRVFEWRWENAGSNETY